MPESLRLLSRLSDPVRPDLTVAWSGGERVSDAAFRARVAGWAGALANIRGTNVALYESDGVEFAAALLGAWHAGKTVFLAADDLPGTVRALASRVDGFAGAWPRVPDAPNVVTAPADGPATTTFGRLDDAFVAVQVFTSGTTGAPQAIPKRLSQLASEVETLERAFGAALTDTRFVATVSHQHIYGLLFKILWPLVAGRAFVARSVEYPEAIIGGVAPGRAVLVTSPSLLKRLSPAVNWQAARANLVAVFSSGGPLPGSGAVLSETLLGQTPIEVLGSSETGGIATRQQHGGQDAAWTPLGGVSVRDAEGTLAVRSAHLADGEWFTTADRAVFADNGTFRLAGRADRIAKIEGKRVSLAAVEAALASSEWIADARVLPLPGSREQLAAVVVPTEACRRAIEQDGKGAVTRTLRALLAQSTERVAIPRRWRFVDALPVNSQGKTSLDTLVTLFVDDAPTLPEVRVVEVMPTRAVLGLRIPENLAYFEGHFPGAPVLPGVAQVHWAIHYARLHFDVRGTFQRLEVVKFHRVIRPLADVTLELDWRAANTSLQYAFHSAGGPHSSGRIVFAS